MKQVWRTYDGAYFEDGTDAAKHEQHLAEQLEMYNQQGYPTEDTTNALFLNIKTEAGARIFLKAVAANEDDGITEGIYEDSTGWHYWDEWSDQYRYIETSVIRTFAKLFGAKI